MPTPLHLQRCEHQSGAPLGAERLTALLPEVPGWAVETEAVGGVALAKTFNFPDYHHTMAFANAVAWIAHQQDHHPDMTLGYNRCTLRWNTHSVGGLSINDFICAARVEALLA